MAAVEYAAPFSASTIDTSQRWRDHRRPTQPDMVDDAYGGTSLVVSDGGAGASINISNGRAIVQGAIYELSGGPLNLAVAANGGGSNRFDIVVLTYDASHTPPIYARIVQGTPGSGLPSVSSNLSGVWDFPLWHYQKAPAGTITAITDRRKFSDAQGGILAADDTTGTNSIGWFPTGPRIGQTCRFWPSGDLHRWTGTGWVMAEADIRCKVRQGTAQANQSRNLNIKVALDTPDFDNRSGLNAGLNRYVFPRLGWYAVSQTVRMDTFTGAGNTTYAESWIALNGVTGSNKYAHSDSDVSQNNVIVTPSAADQIKCTTLGDYIEVYASYRSSLAGSQFNIGASGGGSLNPSLSVQWIGP